MKRKSFIKASLVAAGGSLLPSLAFGEWDRPAKKVLRFAHITDIHLQSGIIPETGMAKMLHHVQQLDPPVEFIMNGGDSIMDALEKGKAETQQQWDLFHQILRNENSLPVNNCIGNHDIWGWFIKDNKPEQDPLYGKGWVVQTQQMKNRFYGFTRGKWHFIVLDSTQLVPGGGYIGQVDPEQLVWLKSELAAIPRDEFICIVSHIPLFSVCSALIFPQREANGDLVIKGNLMHTDFLELKDLFYAHPNIKVCLSGHTHMQDAIEYLGINYYCNGAVCGNWWKGIFHEFLPAYAVIELYDDGSSSRTMINYDPR